MNADQADFRGSEVTIKPRVERAEAPRTGTAAPTGPSGPDGPAQPGVRPGWSGPESPRTGTADPTGPSAPDGPAQPGVCSDPRRSAQSAFIRVPLLLF